MDYILKNNFLVFHPEYEIINYTFDCFYLLEELKVESLSQMIQNIFSNAKAYQTLSRGNIVASISFHWDEEKNTLLDFISAKFRQNFIISSFLYSLKSKALTLKTLYCTLKGKNLETKIRVLCQTKISLDLA